MKYVEKRQKARDSYGGIAGARPRATRKTRLNVLFVRMCGERAGCAGRGAERATLPETDQ